MLNPGVKYSRLYLTFFSLYCLMRMRVSWNVMYCCYWLRSIKSDNILAHANYLTLRNVRRVTYAWRELFPIQPTCSLLYFILFSCSILTFDRRPTHNLLCERKFWFRAVLLLRLKASDFSSPISKRPEPYSTFYVITCEKVPSLIFHSLIMEK